MKYKLFLPLMAATLCGQIFISCSKTEHVSTEPIKDSTIAKLDIYFDSIAPRCMGSILIAQGDSVIYERKMGYADIETQTPITDTTLFKIGSITKSFTALLTLKAVEAGKLSLDDTLSKFFPNVNIPNADSITIFHLLHHRSGIQDYMNDTEGAIFEYVYQPQTKEQMLERFSHLKTNFEPNAAFRYCNTGYVLLAYILEQVNDKSYAELVKEQIAEPLGLTHTFSLTNLTCISTKSYDYDGGWEFEQPWNPSTCVGTGSIVSCTKDLRKYVYALGSGFFGKEALAQMTDFIDGYGMGLYGTPSEDGKIRFSHEGMVERFFSCMKYDDGQVTVTLFNGAGINNSTIQWYISAIQKGEEVSIPSLHFITLDSLQINEYVGEYLCDTLPLNLTNNGKHLMTESLVCPIPVKLEASTKDFFRCLQFDIDMTYNATRDSIRFRMGGDNMVFVKKKQ
ncbi:MAG: beta-lactamase family protein [Paludibacteraceae bacterium]|nr:beta-lactamase family protein [Paludibacteraceae bacterium]